MKGTNNVITNKRRRLTLSFKINTDEIDRATSKEIKLSKKSEKSSLGKSDSTAAVRDIFHSYIEHYDYRKYSIQRKGKRSGELTKERIEVIKRIENAIRNGYDKVTTFEFFSVVDVLSSSVQNKSNVQINVAYFDDKDCLIYKENLFTGELTTGLKYEVNQNVRYYHIPHCVQHLAEAAFIICIVEAPFSFSDDSSSSKKSSRTSRGVSKSNVDWNTFYGVRRIISRKDDELEVKHMNGAVHLTTANGLSNIPFSLNDLSWMESHEKVQRLSCLTQAASVKSPIPTLIFETSDQHVEEDWDEIKEEMKERDIQRVASPSEIGKIQFLTEVKTLTSPNKENGTPGRVLKDTSRFIMGMASYSCPFSLREFDDIEALVVYLNRSFHKLSFRLENATQIVVSENTSLPKVDMQKTGDESSVRKAIKKKIPVKRSIGRFNYTNAPFPAVVRQQDEFFPGQNYQIHSTSSKWYDEHIHRRIGEFVDASQKEKYFMEQVNLFFANDVRFQPVSRLQKLREVRRFVEKNREWIDEGNFLAHLAAFLTQLFTAGILQGKEVYDLLISFVPCPEETV